MNFFSNLLIFAGLILMVIGLVEVVRKLRWGNFLAGKDVSGVYDVMKLQELNRKIRDDVTETVTDAKNCFQVFQILAGTQFRNMAEPTFLVLKDNTWKRTREQALNSVKRGYKDCDKFLKYSMDPAILLLKEAFRFSIQTCFDCPILRGKPGEMKQCPITQNLKTETKPQ